MRDTVSEKEEALGIGEKYNDYQIDIEESRLDPREYWACRLAHKMAVDPHEVTTPFFNQLREHFTDDEIVEMTFAASIFNWGNKFNITMQMDTDEQSDYEHNLEYEEVQS